MNSVARLLSKRPTSQRLFYEVRKLHFAQFRHEGELKVGVFVNNDQQQDAAGPGRLISLSDTDGKIPPNMREIIQGDEGVQERIHRALSSTNRRMVSLQNVKLLPPVYPEKILMVGLNYIGHCREQNVKIPETPVISAKLINTLVGHGDDVIHSAETQELDWEVELAIVMGRTCKNVQEADAMNSVFGFTVANDVTGRDLQRRKNGKQWVLGKGLDTTCPLGPYIVDKESIGDPNALGIRCRVNGVVKQESNTNDMIFNTRRLVSYITRFITLNPGDVIITGTPAGVGFARTPPEFLQAGDTVECEIDGIGTLTNKIVAPL